MQIDCSLHHTQSTFAHGLITLIPHRILYNYLTRAKYWTVVSLVTSVWSVLLPRGMGLCFIHTRIECCKSQTLKVCPSGSSKVRTVHSPWKFPATSVRLPKWSA